MVLFLYLPPSMLYWYINININQFSMILKPFKSAIKNFYLSSCIHPEPGWCSIHGIERERRRTSRSRTNKKISKNNVLRHNVIKKVSRDGDSRTKQSFLYPIEMCTVMLLLFQIIHCDCHMLILRGIERISSKLFYYRKLEHGKMRMIYS